MGETPRTVRDGCYAADEDVVDEVTLQDSTSVSRSRPSSVNAAVRSDNCRRLELRQEGETAVNEIPKSKFKSLARTRTTGRSRPIAVGELRVCRPGHPQNVTSRWAVHADAVEAVGPERAVRAALVPVGPEHEVVDDQLAPGPTCPCSASSAPARGRRSATSSTGRRGVAVVRWIIPRSTALQCA
jgi:hypothetical protein